MKMKKSIMAILTATIMILSSLGPVLYIQTVQGADPASWYKTVNGVLGTDTYLLYPYLNKSSTIGFSQFGETIDGNTKTGLSYDAIDPFAPPGGSPPEWQWIEGWILNITYVQGGRYKNVWALATYSDYQDSLGIGGNWHENVTVGSIDLSIRGGRKTSGGAVTDPIQVLYDGPRRYVALCKTTIYDSIGHLTPLVSLTFTIDFNKVKKEVIIYKDVKRIDVGKNLGPMQIEFGDRGEWDLGAGAPPKSYARFYTGNTTVYDHNWQPWYENAIQGYDGTYDVCQIIDDELAHVGWAAFWPKPILHWVGATQEEADRDTILTSMVTITDDQEVTATTQQFFTPIKGTPTPYPQNTSAGVQWIEDPMVFVNDVHKIINSSDIPKSVTYWRANDTVKFPDGYVPRDGDIVRLVYKDGTQSKEEMSSEPNSPFVIGEWAFEMSEAPSIFRGVTVYGVTDLNDGDDYERPDGVDNFDREAAYQLDEIFNPWDLSKAVEKDTSRWVEFTFGPTWTSDRRPVMNVSYADWDQYCTFSERVEDLNTSTLLNRWQEDYTFWVADDGYGHITGLTSSHYYKITYSTDTAYDQDPFNLTNTVVNRTTANLTTGINWDGVLGDDWTDPLDVSHEIDVEEFTFDILNVSSKPSWPTDMNLTWTYTGPTLEWQVEPFKVFKEDVATLEVGSDSYENVSIIPTVNQTVETNSSYALQFHIQYLEIVWNITPPSGPLFTDYKDVHFYGWDNDVDTVITVTYSNVTGNFTFSARLEFVNDVRDEPLYTEYIPGRYEWGIVGRDAASVDSAGLSLVSAAFKNKQVEYGIAGVDMFSSNPQLQMPWVVNKVGAGDAFTNYHYNNPTDQRVGLRDDWCTTWPITTSNIIAVGGPLINLVSYYGNDFISAFYGESWLTPYTSWQNKIDAVTCWNKKAYGSSNTTGYATISTYKDINGTVLFLIWGDYGRDTFYVTKWFHEYGIMQLQDAPAGLTSIIVKIPYTSYPEGYKPGTPTIVECLGTISETLWTHNSETKGGIHDP
jgi:hypothetical protein